jgi:endonuclease/exonuclease/phosphatase family metal-dependent hydrolase
MKARKSLSLITINVLGATLLLWTVKQALTIKKRLNKIAEEVNTSQADIVAFQEVFTYAHLRFLRSHMPDFPYAAYKKSVVGPRGGLVIFSRVPLDSVTFHGFQTKGKLFDRTVVGKLARVGYLITKIKGEPTYVINTHLTPNLDSDWNPHNTFVPIIEAQLKELAQVVNLLMQANNNVIIAGDFNTAKDSHLYQTFLMWTKMKDAFHNDNTPTTIGELLAKDKPEKRIDYIFFSNNKSLVVTNTDHLFKKKKDLGNGKFSYLSDHIGLQVELSYTEREKKLPN